jgi:hypothetical protein
MCSQRVLAWPTAEEPGCTCLSRSRSSLVPIFHRDILFNCCVETLTPSFLNCDHLCNRGTMACTRHLPQSSLFCMDTQEFARPLSRFSMVLLYKRATSPVSRPQIFPRLQHSASHLVLAFSVECISSGHGFVAVQAKRSRRARASACRMLDHFYLGFLHVFYDARVFLHAVLSGVGIVDWFSHGERGEINPRCNADI